MTSLAPTDEQFDIVTAATTTSDNLMINALAGTGKTHTLRMIERAQKAKPILYLVFNRKNADDAEYLDEDEYNALTEKADTYEEEMAKRMLSTTTVRTFNSIGHRIWAEYCTSKVVLDRKKTYNLFDEIVKEFSKPDASDAWSSYTIISDGVSEAKALGYIPDGKYPAARRLLDRASLHAAMDEPPDELAAELIDRILLLSITKAYKGLIDYDDQIYMPALFGGTFPKFPLVLVDEYQDQSPVNHALLERLIRGRVIGVGDPWQNIYGFRGAKADGMTDASERYAMVQHNLSISFRCPEAIVRAARWRVPHFKWNKRGGYVGTENLFAGDGFDDDASIICRNNAPLLRLAFKLINAGRSVNVMGSDMGPRLIAIMRKLGPDNMTKETLFANIEQWREDRVLAGSKTANDLADCMRVFADHGSDLAQAISYAEHLFKQAGTIRLLTGHKSKGLEFSNVYFLDPWLLSDSEQDKNLRYVIQTRSLNSLITLDSKAITW